MSEQPAERYEESELYRIRHSAAHIMAEAVMEMFPGQAKVGETVTVYATWVDNANIL